MASSRMIWVKLAAIMMGKLFAIYATSSMTTFLNTVWEMRLTYSSAIVNVYGGMAAILPLLVHFIKDTLMCDYWMIVLCNCSHTIGFLLLTMSTPPVLHKATGTCSAYEARCIGQVQSNLFYMSLVLLALGSSGRFMVEKFRKEQLIKLLLDGDKIMQFLFSSVCPKNIKAALKGTKLMNFFWSARPKKIKLQSFLILVSILVGVTTAYVKPWLLKFAIPAICTFAVALTCFTSSRPQKAEGSLLTREEVRSISRMSLVCLFVIPNAFVSSLGNTYFTIQASNMNHKVGPIKASILFLKGPQTFVRQSCKSKQCANMIPPRVGILLSMVLAILCCITAALVEERRVGVAKGNDLPDETVPMSMFWLLPQYLFAGGVSGFSSMGITRFFTEEVLHWPKQKDDVDDVEVDEALVDHNKERENSKRQYIDFFADAVEGVGKSISPVTVYAVSQIKPTWFQASLNRSQLYNYYWTLAAICAAVLLCFSLIFYWLGLKTKKISTADDDEGHGAANEGEDGAVDQEGEDNAAAEGGDRVTNEEGDDNVAVEGEDDAANERKNNERSEGPAADEEAHAAEEEGEDCVNEDGHDNVTVDEEREDDAAANDRKNNERSEGLAEVDKVCEEVTHAADEDGKVDAANVIATIDMTEVKERLDEAKDHLGDEAKFSRHELHEKEHRHMALYQSHIIDIAAELNEVDNQYAEESDMKIDILQSTTYVEQLAERIEEQFDRGKGKTRAQRPIWYSESNC